MNEYKICKVVNNVSTFKNESTGAVVMIPHRTWTNTQKVYMREFLNPSSTRKFKFEGRC